jgi:Flp pilus assembly protein TadD
VKSARRRILGLVWVAVLAAVALPSVRARANVQSEALYSRGLIAFNSGEWNEAYRLFNEAVQADSTDAVALYYRGLTQARRGDSASAIQDMEHALKLNPSLPHVALDLGIAYFDAGRYAEAKSWLERAHQQGYERLTASFFLGLTFYRLGDDAAAQTYLQEATADPELEAAARFYAGLSLLRQGDTQGARGEMAQVARLQPQSEIGEAAQKYIGGEAVAKPVTGAALPKRWSAFGRLAFQYDSNVVIAPTSSDLQSAIGISRQSDGATVVAAGGDYTLLDTGNVWMQAHYDLYQSIHFQLTKFDLTGQRLRLDIASKAARVSYGFAAIYDLYFLDYQTFFQEGLGTPWVTFAEGTRAATQVYYTLRAQDFFRSPYSPYRDGFDNAFGARQYVNLWRPDAVLGFGYQFDMENTAGSKGGNDFQYKANQFDVDVALPLYSVARAELAYLFRLEDYQFPNSRNDYQFARHDQYNQFAVALVHDLTANLALNLDYILTFDASNIADFDYNRNIVSVGVQVTF